MPIIGQISVGDGATFTPAVDNDGVISWSNNKNLPNPASVDIPQAVIDRYQLAPTSNPTFTGVVTAEDVTASGDVGVGGDLSVTGAITGDLTGNVTGDLTGNVTGNVTGAATSATNDGNGNNIANTYLPAVVGAVVAFAGSTSPAGWLLCNGAAVSRTTYAALFAVIGTTYGTGDGSTTFNLPNLVDKFVEGSATAGTVKSAGLPNVVYEFGLRKGELLGGGFTSIVFANTSTTISEVTSSSGSVKLGNTAPTYDKVKLDSSLYNSIYGNSNTVQPPAVTMRYIIKY